MGCRSVRLSRFRNLLGPEPDLLARVVGLDFGMLLLTRHRVSQARLIWCEWVSLGRSKAMSQLRLRRSSSDVRRPVEFCGFERQVGKLPDGGNDRVRKNELPDWRRCLPSRMGERAGSLRQRSQSLLLCASGAEFPTTRVPGKPPKCQHEDTMLFLERRRVFLVALRSVSIQPATGFVRHSWLPSPVSNSPVACIPSPILHLSLFTWPHYYLVSCETITRHQTVKEMTIGRLRCAVPLYNGVMLNCALQLLLILDSKSLDFRWITTNHFAVLKYVLKPFPERASSLMFVSS